MTPKYEGTRLVLKFLNPSPPSRATVVLDPGHSDSDPGQEASPKDERIINREMAALVKAKLEAKGILVYVVPTPANTTLQSRIDFTESHSADIFVSIHHNSNPDKSKVGTEVFYWNRQSKALATLLSGNVSSALNTTNRGAKFDYYYVTRQQICPAVLIECGFMTNAAEYKKLLDSSYKNSIAQGIADGIAAYLNSNYVSSPTGTEQS
jgi:N-acetylmuramoyl-L-alanine amidase